MVVVSSAAPVRVAVIEEVRFAGFEVGAARERGAKRMGRNLMRLEEYIFGVLVWLGEVGLRSGVVGVDVFIGDEYLMKLQ